MHLEEKCLLHTKLAGREVCCISYNSRGFSQIKIDFMNYLTSTEAIGNKIPILCNQENFMLRDNSYKLTRAFPNFQLIINPAVKLTHDKGRPRNGMFIAIPQSIRNCITDVSPGFWRIQAIIINLGETATLLINSYFPTDPRRANVDESELLETLGHIKNVIRKHDFDSLLWAGDINADFSRNTSHTSRVSEDLEELGLIRSWDRFVLTSPTAMKCLGQVMLQLLTTSSGVTDCQIM